MLTALTLTFLASSPAVGLTLSAQLGNAATAPAPWLDAIEQELIAGTLPVRRLELSCEGSRECLLAGAKRAGVPALVAVTLASGKKETTLDLEAVRVGDGATLSQLTFSLTGRLTDADREAVRKFAQRLGQALTEVSADAPPAEKQPLPPIVARYLPRSQLPGFLLGGGGAAGTLTSAIFFGLATSARQQVENTPDPSPLTRAQANQLARDANFDYSVALVAALAAVAFATGLVVWLLAEAE